MKKTNFLLGGALLLVALFTTSCDKLMSKLDNPVGSYASIDSAPTDKGPGDEFTLTVSTISDGAVTWTSSDTDIAEVEGTGTTATVIAKRSGKVTITADVAATENYQAGSASCEVTLRVNNFKQLKSDIANAAGSKEIVVLLADNAVIDLTSELNLTGKKTQIIGNKEKPATFKVTTKSITIDGAFKLANVNVDATGQTASFIKGYKQSNGETLTKVESGQYVIKEPIVLEGITAKNMEKAFFDCNSTAYVYETFTINDCFVHYKTQGNVVLNFSSAMAINFNITNSTFYSTTAGSANFIALSGKRPWQVTGYENETGKLTCANNTFYNLATGSKNMFLNTNTLKGQIYLYEMNSNIFVETSYQKKIYTNMTNNKKQVTTDGKNTYLHGTTFFSETNYNGDEGLQSDPGFADAANGDFTLSESSLQYENKTGDPRWIK